MGFVLLVILNEVKILIVNNLQELCPRNTKQCSDFLDSPIVAKWKSARS